MNELRRQELVRVLKEMLTSINSLERVDDWSYQVFMAATQPPPVVQHAAEALGRWNCYGNPPLVGSRARFQMEDCGEGYETIAEIVLTAAKEFERSAEDSNIEDTPTWASVPDNSPKIPNHWELPALTFSEMATKLKDIRRFLASENDAFMETARDEFRDGFRDDLNQIIRVLEFINANFQLVSNNSVTPSP
jgi:hypothetical protein